MGKRGVVHIDFYFDDFLSGVTYLSPEERGVYMTLCALFWSRQGALPDNDQANARACNTSTRSYRRIKDALVDSGKLQVRDGMISQRRAADELGAARKRVEQHIEAGAAGGRAKAEREAAQNSEKNAKKTAEKLLLAAPNSEEKPKENNKPGVAALSTHQPPLLELEANASVDKAVDHFLLAWRLFPHFRGRSASMKICRQAWDREAAKVSGGGAALLSAVARYASEDQQHRGDCGAPAFERWLKQGRYEAWLDGTGPTAASGRQATPDPLDQWRRRVTAFHKPGGYWNTNDWGPEPGRPGCTVPPAVLAETQPAAEQAA